MGLVFSLWAEKKTLGLRVDRDSLSPFALANALGFPFCVMGELTTFRTSGI